MKIEQPIVIPESKFEGWDKVTKLVPILARSMREPKLVFTIIKVGEIYLFIGKDGPNVHRDIDFADGIQYMNTHVEFVRYYGPDDKLTIQGG